MIHDVIYSNAFCLMGTILTARAWTIESICNLQANNSTLAYFLIREVIIYVITVMAIAQKWVRKTSYSKKCLQT